MNTRKSQPGVAGWLVPLLVLLAAAAAMTLNAGGVTTALRALQYDLYSRWNPGTGEALPSGDLIAATIGDVRSGAWLSNAVVLWPQLLFLAFAGAALVVLLARRRVGWAAAFTVAAIGAAMGLAWLLFARARLFADSLSPSVALTTAFASALAVRALKRSRERARLSRTYADSVAPEALQQITRTPALVNAQAEERTVTYLSCRIRGIDGPNRNSDAAGVMRLLNSVSAPLIEAVTSNSGTVAYAGADRLAAFWNAPLEDGEHAAHACEAALRMSYALAQMKDRQETVYDPIQLGVGIATGRAVAGTLETRNSYTVAGACIDLADRLARLSDRYGPAILVSEATRDAAEGSFAMLEIDSLADADDRPLKLYALLGNPLVRASPKFRALATFHDHLFQAIRAQRWSDARTLIAQCGKLSGAIPRLYDLHLARIAWYENHPPPSDWDGAFRPPVT
jgi:adenylate cyclase